ncbi:MAG: hypothetical protein HQL26_10595 [Candidatus Omnitrophica bacterium]|nr:hypothetical protein [Candidatus Omnitrophota bacterium]
MTSEKSKQVGKENFIKTVSFGTGIICRKVAGIGKVAQTKPWKNVVSSTHKLCDTVGTKTKTVFEKVKKSVSKNTKDITKSFKAGMEDSDEAVIDIKPISSAVPIKRTATLAKKKTTGKATGKNKTSAKKAKNKAGVEKKVPVNADLEKEIESITKNVKE